MELRKKSVWLVIVSTFLLFQVPAYAHGKGIFVVFGIWFALAGIVLGIAASILIGVVRFRGDGLKRFLFKTALSAIPISIIMFCMFIILFCTFGLGFKLMQQAGKADGIGSLAVYVALSLLFGLLVYIWTLSFGWLPIVLSKNVRWLPWVLPPVSAGILLALAYPALSEEGVRPTWLHAVPTAACLISAFVAGMTIVASSRLISTFWSFAVNKLGRLAER